MTRTVAVIAISFRNVKALGLWRQSFRLMKAVILRVKAMVIGQASVMINLPALLQKEMRERVKTNVSRH